jgi:hypothetical protein
MTRKDFELIARVLREAHSQLTAGSIAAIIVESLAEDFAHDLAATNPRFDRARFLKAATKCS